MRNILKILLLAMSYCLLPSCASAQANSKVVEAALACRVAVECPYFSKIFVDDPKVGKAVLALFTKAKIAPPDWISAGVESPNLPITFGGRLLILGEVCEPHNCGNSVSFIYDPKAGRLVGRLIYGTAQWLGSPNAKERRLLSDLDAEGTRPYRLLREPKPSLPLFLGAQPNQSTRTSHRFKIQ